MIEAAAVRYEPMRSVRRVRSLRSSSPIRSASASYESEAELERSFIELLRGQAYEYLPITSEAQLVANLRTQLEALNGITFSDAEWDRLLHRADRRAQ